MIDPSERLKQTRSAAEWLVSLPTLMLLLLVLLIGTGELVHSRFLQIGQALFGDQIDQVQYYALRNEARVPDCNPRLDIEAEVRRWQAQSRSPTQGDTIDQLMAPTVVSDEALRQSLQAALAQCQDKHRQYQQLLDSTTDEVRLFRSVEQGFFALFHFGTEHRTMIVLLLMAITLLITCVSYQHISLVSPRFQRDYRVQSGSTLLASAMLLWSSLRYLQISSDSGVPIEQPEQHMAWVGLFSAMLVISAWQFRVPPRLSATQGLGTWSQALRTVPLGSLMTMLAGSYYFIKGHPSGLAIYVSSLTEIPSLTLHLALFIWCGMLFKQSRMIDLFMNLLRPWQLSPETLTYLILLAAAVPTAYTGGSGAFVMAAGAIIYHEIRNVGGSRQYALGATAMSGSLGVVISPSLIVMSIVAVNNQVTSAELFYWGNWVFLMTSTLFFLASQWRRPTRTRQWPSVLQALPAMMREVPPLLSHVALVLAVLGMYRVVLHTELTETSAALIMPVVMLLVVGFDQLMRAQGIGPDPRQMAHALRRENSLRASVRVSTSETATHLGGYIYLILLSQALGGVIERSDLMQWAPSHFDTPYAAMAFLAGLLVLLGMFMEPLGAIFLVSSSLAPLAMANGIDPVHFWMLVLVAFELGYLLPPVALNQLLARQVVGHDRIDRADAEVASLSFYRRHERWILPCGVMAVSLLLVGFVPLVVHDVPWLAPWASRLSP
ncbi:MAG TPA: TRAP transporter large permease subunit [Aquabacterium sp.]|nr:TRAP transporter large permease subunit [Aquabacterium sp.]HRH28271.1 TRAP transporter large permease subunit [Aquabacterium sp.]